jgi:hypothetical protein
LSVAREVDDCRRIGMREDLRRNVKSLWCVVLIVILSVLLVKPAEAKGYPSGGAIVAAIVGVVAALAVVTYVVIHESSKKRTITGCVSSGESGMSLTDEKDKRSYALTGSTADVKPGDRVTLQGKRIRPKDAGKPLLWETKAISKDFGVCPPQV